MSSEGPPAPQKRAVSRGLRFRAAALLAVALLPIGVLGILQTRELANEVQARSELTLLALTNSSAFGERQIIERAFGAAEALSTVLQVIREDPESCRRYLGDYLDATSRYTFIGYMETDGTMKCSSADRELDLSDDRLLLERMAAGRAWVSAIDEPVVSREHILNVMHPAMRDDEVMGYISISVPKRLLLTQDDASTALRPRSLATFNAEGELLSKESTMKDNAVYLPAHVSLAALVGSQADTFVAEDQTGEERVFALMPIIPDLVYALAAWPREETGLRLFGISLSPALFPLAMFLASLAVAYIAVDVLVVRHIKVLRQKMLAFSRTRKFNPPVEAYTLSAELEDLEYSFADMALALLDDEAQMEDALREKNVLLKEVHHRVKNNLQLISSIMNMQIRKSRSAETETVLKRLQERILALSSVHRNLYQAENLSQTNAGALLSDLFDELLAVGAMSETDIDREGDFEQVILFPDQAVPLSLLASELFTNALKFAGAPEGVTPLIRASLKLIGEGKAELICENSIETPPEEESGANGLGSQLTRAFAAQLGGKLDISNDNGRHTVRVTFDVEEFDTEPADY